MLEEITHRTDAEVRELFNASLRAVVSTALGLDDGCTVTRLPHQYAYSITGGLVWDKNGRDTVADLVRKFDKWFHDFYCQDTFHTTNFTVGTWEHEGLVYVDVTTSAPSLMSALRSARAHDQMSIWDRDANDGAGAEIMLVDYEIVEPKRETRRMK